MPVNVPNRFTAGTTFKLTSAVGMTFYLRGPASVTLESSSRDGIILCPANDTAKWPPGLYAYSLRKHDDSGTVSEISTGTIQILPDIATLDAGTDIRSQNWKIFDAICAVIERRASIDQQSYKINNRELVRTPIADLLRLRAQYASYVAQENGRGGFREHRVHF